METKTEAKVRAGPLVVERKRTPKRKDGNVPCLAGWLTGPVDDGWTDGWRGQVCTVQAQARLGRVRSEVKWGYREDGIVCNRTEQGTRRDKTGTPILCQAIPCHAMPARPVGRSESQVCREDV